MILFDGTLAIIIIMFLLCLIGSAIVYEPPQPPNLTKYYYGHPWGVTPEEIEKENE